MSSETPTHINPDELRPTPNENFTLTGELFSEENPRTTQLTPEGLRRLHENGAVVVMAGFFPGASGSSTATKELAKQLDCPYLSTGDAMRGVAEKNGLFGDIGLQEFLAAHQDDPDVDYQIDVEMIARARELAKEHGIVIVDSKAMYMLWSIFANSSEDPLFITESVMAKGNVARERSVPPEREKARQSGKPIPSDEEIFANRRNRLVEDKKRLNKSYPHISAHYHGRQNVPEASNFIPVDASSITKEQMGL